MAVVVVLPACLHEDAKPCGNVTIKKALLKFEHLNEFAADNDDGQDSVEGEDIPYEEVAEVPAVLAVLPEEYPRFVTGFGMDVAGMMQPSTRGPRKAGGGASEGHNYTRPTLSAISKKWQCLYCKSDFAQLILLNPSRLPLI